MTKQETPAPAETPALTKEETMFMVARHKVKKEIRKLAKDDGYPIVDVTAALETVDIVECGRVVKQQKVFRVVIIADRQRGYIDFIDFARVIVRGIKLPKRYDKTLEFLALPESSPANLV